MRNILMGVAAIALAAGGAYAQPGNGNGNGNGNGGGNGNAAAKSNGGNGNGNANRGNAGGGNARAVQPGNNGNARSASNGNGNGNAGNRADVSRGNGPANVRGNNGNGNGNAPVRSVDNNGNGNSNAAIRTVGNNGNGNGNNGPNRGNDGRILRAVGDVFGYNTRNTLARDYGLIQGCPPGLAKKNNGCNPPGLVNRNAYAYDRSSWWGLPGLIDGRYRYYDNNLVRLSSAGAILGYYPLLGGSLAPGNVWPTWFNYEPVPRYYESYYGLGPRGSYRYADNVLYRVDPDTAAINSIAALLTGDTIQVGQPMPMGYSVYNVPYGYRDRYVDGPNAYYRYSDGYVYEVDPTTQLVSAAIELLL